MGHDSDTKEAKAQKRGHPRLVVLTADGVFSHALDRAGAFVIGRGEDADIRVDAPGISRRHASITFEKELLSVRDLNSKNGVVIDGRAIAPDREHPFEPGQFLQLGEASIVVQAPLSELSPARAGELRAPAGRFSFFALRIGGELEERAVQLALSAFMQKGDQLAARSRTEWELILADTGAELAEQAAAGIKFALGRQGASVQIGIAESPAEGRELSALRATASARAAFSSRTASSAGGAIVASGDMKKLYRTLERIAASELSVVILGETGVGKEVVARTIHACSKRAEQRFVALNCAAFAEQLLESELFGHEKGAFTGALSEKPGLFELADGGTIFLDELGEMPQQTQTKLLRVIEERTIRRIGSVEERPIDVRFVCATNSELELDVEEGRFRQDLYYRLNSFSIVVPPLRERVEEIEALAHAFLAKAWEKNSDGGEPKISADVLHALRAHRWPGNVRELKNVIERAVVLAGGEAITVEHLPPGFGAGGAPADAASDGATLSAEMERFEREQIVRALEECNGNQTKAAAKLGLSRKVLMARLDRYGISRPRKG